MILNLLIAVAVLGIGYFLSLVIWPKINTSWLSELCRWVVISLPFERIPSVQLGGGNVRISQVLVLIGLWFLLILFLKKDKLLLAKKFHQNTFILVLFVIVSATSWFNIEDFNRFLNTYIATVITFAAFFLIANFTENILERIKELSVTMFFVGLFSVYQFVGDLAGLPILATGLREQYTKVVFGIPRIHGTALEPLYFAGMYFVPIFASLVFIFTKKHFFKTKLRFTNIYLLFFFLLIFFLTLSKGAYPSLVAALGIFVVYGFKKLKMRSFLETISSFGFMVFILISFVLLYSDYIFSIVNRYWEHILGTLNFTETTSVERLGFLTMAFKLLENNFLWGIGSGQFGVLAKAISPLKLPGTSFLIVNNVYVEVWLEFGIFAALIFIWFILWPVFKQARKLIKEKYWHTDNLLAASILVPSLLAYYIQWLFFSPIFIMPIFILIGLLARLDLEEVDLKSKT